MRGSVAVCVWEGGHACRQSAAFHCLLASRAFPAALTVHQLEAALTHRRCR